MIVRMRTQCYRTREDMQSSDEGRQGLRVIADIF
jgi:hypothetical protein